MVSSRALIARGFHFGFLFNTWSASRSTIYRVNYTLTHDALPQHRPAARRAAPRRPAAPPRPAAPR